MTYWKHVECLIENEVNVNKRKYFYWESPNVLVVWIAKPHFSLPHRFKRKNKRPENNIKLPPFESLSQIDNAYKLRGHQHIQKVAQWQSLSCQLACLTTLVKINDVCRPISQRFKLITSERSRFIQEFSSSLVWQYFCLTTQYRLDLNQSNQEPVQTQILNLAFDP